MKALFIQAVVLVVLAAAGGWLSFRHHPEAPALYLHLETQVAEGEVSLAMVRELEVLEVDAPMAELMPVFDAGKVAIVMDGTRFLGLITRIDLLNYLRRRVQ